MKWQEYEDAVATLYEQLDGIGAVKRNVFIADRDAGQTRQVDVLIELQTKGHAVNIVVDAKYRKSRINVKDVEASAGLVHAVGGCKGALVTTNGWTAPAALKAERSNVDLRILTLEEALDIMVPDKWELCPGCNVDCIVLDHHGALDLGGVWFWWMAGQCRSCRLGFAWCQECGDYIHIPEGEEALCVCGHRWSVRQDRMYVMLVSSNQQINI